MANNFSQKHPIFLIGMGLIIFCHFSRHIHMFLKMMHCDTLLIFSFDYNNINHTFLYYMVIKNSDLWSSVVHHEKKSTLG